MEQVETRNLYAYQLVGHPSRTGRHRAFKQSRVSMSVCLSVSVSSSVSVVMYFVFCSLLVTICTRYQLR